MSYNDNDDDRKTAIEINKKLIKILDELLHSCSFEDRQFLLKAKKKIESLKAGTESLLSEISDETLKEKTSNEPVFDLQNGCFIYILLFQQNYENLSIWDAMIKSLPLYGVTRQIYNDEISIRNFIKSKDEPLKYGYVKAYIENSNIIKLISPRKDALGTTLITIKDRSIKTKNILELVHADKRYQIVNGTIQKTA